MKTAIARLIVENYGGSRSHRVLKAQTPHGNFWLLNAYGTPSYATWREGEEVRVSYYPDDQFCQEIVS